MKQEPDITFIFVLLPVAYPDFWVRRGLKIIKGNKFWGVRRAEPPDAGEILKIYAKFFM